MVLDNQQGKTFEEGISIGWLAGIIDGEGSFLFTKRHKRQTNYYQPRISLVMTDFAALDRLNLILPQFELPYHVVLSTRQYEDYSKNLWQVDIQGFQRCYKWCNFLKPYLVTKYPDCSRMLEFLDSRNSIQKIGTKAIYKAPYSVYEIELAESLRNRTRRSQKNPSQTTREPSGNNPVDGIVGSV